jgi:hypothetical protein
VAAVPVTTPAKGCFYKGLAENYTPLTHNCLYYYDNVERYIYHALDGQVFEFADAKAFLTAHSLFHMENFGFGSPSPRRSLG